MKWAALPAGVYAMIVGAGFGEETVFRGYLFERFGKLFGSLAAQQVLAGLDPGVVLSGERGRPQC